MGIEINVAREFQMARSLGHDRDGGRCVVDVQHVQPVQRVKQMKRTSAASIA